MPLADRRNRLGQPLDAASKSVALKLVRIFMDKREYKNELFRSIKSTEASFMKITQ
jgi:hypothetical protein